MSKTPEKIRKEKEYAETMHKGKVSWQKNRKKNSHLIQKKKKRK